MCEQILESLITPFDRVYLQTTSAAFDLPAADL